ncbi:hypothetical protein SAMN04489740_4385 [Arthrobacter alpinus]|uniref:HTH arsR-type domain-containing protein n=2 Tax=Arthrobacter alpinus TaxID=656366 RepID=A0A1H5PIF7_9MICC|nr:hypothetical protein SAMN04489740_3990 [Arthrobacter alpinus]SEF13484.1 hypothetical protein SAMN04489740_4382 [Arthrobacter alpinus]SEF13505.1 hypothetical protein SAMN04489740_4385 [Arthrobacter alpinus]
MCCVDRLYAKGRMMNYMPRIIRTEDPAWSDLVEAAVQALGNSVRAGVVRFLRSRPEGATKAEIRASLNILSTTLNGALDVLESTGVIKPRLRSEQGRRAIVFTLDTARCDELQQAWLDYVSGN